LQYDEPWKGYELQGRTLTLSLGKDATGKQLKLTLTLSQALPHWVSHDHIRQCRIVKEGYLYSGRREVSFRRAWRFNGLGLTSGVG